MGVKLSGHYLWAMPTAPKPIDIPPEAAKAFMRDLRAYHSAKNGDARTAIAARQAEQLSKHVRSIVKLAEVKELFERMRGDR
ncbi:hypothetical protein ACVILK_001158 [Bradyrhizobium embrapense]